MTKCTCTGWMTAVWCSNMKIFNRLHVSLPTGRHAVIAIPFLWLLLFFLLPFVLVLKISFAELQIAIPPYTALLEWSGEQLRIVLNIGNYILLGEDSIYLLAYLGSLKISEEIDRVFAKQNIDSIYLLAYLGSLKIALISTLLCLLIGYPMAYAIANSSPSTRLMWLLLMMMPTWTALLIRTYAWMGILGNTGLLNQFLLWLGVIKQPLKILNTNAAVYIGVVYTYLPFMVLPLYANLIKHDNSLIEAAQDLGARRFTSFWRITFPLSKGGIIAGCMLVFIPVVGEFVIPELLGGPETLMIGKVLWQEFFNNRDWPVASALAVVMLLILLVPILLFNRIQAKELEK